MNKNFTSEISTDEYPEVTQADLDRAVYRRDLKLAEKKQRITIMLDKSILEHFKAKAGQKSYQTLINDTLKLAISNAN